MRQELQRAREAGDERWHNEILDRYEGWRGDLSLFLKEMKLRVLRDLQKDVIGTEGANPHRPRTS